jgi:hypothetical protein
LTDISFLLSVVVTVTVLLVIPWFYAMKKKKMRFVLLFAVAAVAWTPSHRSRFVAMSFNNSLSSLSKMHHRCEPLFEGTYVEAFLQTDSIFVLSSWTSRNEEFLPTVVGCFLPHLPASLSSCFSCVARPMQKLATVLYP